MPNRRQFLATFAALPAVSLDPSRRSVSLTPQTTAAGAPARDYLRDLDVPTFINASEPYTSLSASNMLPEVRNAMDYLATRHVRSKDLHDAVGKRIAHLIGCEAAMITTGAASALTLGTAACMTGSNAERIKRLPDTTGMRNEVVIQKAHRYDYEHAVRACGVRMIEVVTRADLERAVGDRTVLLLFNNRWNAQGEIKDAEFVALGKRFRVPTFNDCASDIPPAENLSKYLKMGFDLVTFSGGKGLRGPASAGLLLGRADLIVAARLNTSPHDDTIGRGMKLNKEEILGMLVAVERCLKGAADEWNTWNERVHTIATGLNGLRGVTMEPFLPPVSYRVPHLRVRWDEAIVRITPDEVRNELRNGSPSIETRTGPDPVIGIELGVFMLEPDEVSIVTRRVREILEKATH